MSCLLGADPGEPRLIGDKAGRNVQQLGECPSPLDRPIQDGSKRSDFYHDNAILAEDTDFVRSGYPQCRDFMAEAITSYWDLVEPVFASIDSTDSKGFAASTAALPREVILLYATHFCLSEVHNGGFLQFFWNSTGLIAPEAIDGFIALGMPKMAELVRQAASMLGSPYPRDRDSRWNALLQASGRSQRELKKIFKRNENLYLAFAEATQPLGYGVINREALDLAKSESRGFQEAATAYARSFSKLQ